MDIIVALEGTTGWTIGTVMRVLTVDHVTNRENTMATFAPIQWAGLVRLTKGGIVIPVQIACEPPWTRGRNEIAHQLIKHKVTNAVDNVACDNGPTNGQLTDASLEYGYRRVWLGSGEHGTGK